MLRFSSMIHHVKELMKRVIPARAMLWYHKFLSMLAAAMYRHPSREMLVIGVTGTNGKSTTCHLITRVLEATEHKVGMATTVEFQIGSKKWLNNTKMTMLGRFQLQKLLRKMVDEKVKYAVLEISSQGLMQHRADGIDVDVAVLTNLTPEHIEAHGSFEAYKKEKGKLFDNLSKSIKKYSVTESLGEKVYANNKAYEDRSPSEQISKTIIVNGDDEHRDYFAQFDAQEKYLYGIDDDSGDGPKGYGIVRATNVQCKPDHTTFRIGHIGFHLQLPGVYNVYNALAAISVGLSRGMDFRQLAKILSGPISIPGRFERIDEGQDFDVIVDYAPELASMEALQSVIKNMDKNNVIHVLGACGGGRDTEKRPTLGKMAAEVADTVIVTNEDPYDDDPQEIIDQVAAGAQQAGKIEGANLFSILDRTQAIQKAINIAQSGDVVLLTGKGAEQAMCIAGGKKVKWDDRQVARDALKRRE